VTTCLVIIWESTCTASSFFLGHCLCHALGTLLPSDAVVCVAQSWGLGLPNSWMLVVHLEVGAQRAAVRGPAIQLLQAN
jgi:hypothetical protein